MNKFKKTNELFNKVLKGNITIKADSADGDGIVEAYVSVFNNVDSYGDIILPGAFKNSLEKKLPKGVWMHNWDMPIAKTLEAKEDPHGLYIKAQLILEVEKAREAYALMKNGVIDEFSIGFYINEAEFDDENHRIIKEITLIEWSPVLAGANPDTQLISVKKKAKEGDVCEMPDGEPGEMHPDDNGDMVCMAKKAKKDPQDDETTPDDKTPDEDKTDETTGKIEVEAEGEKTIETPEEKVGKVLSEKNRNLVQTTIEELDNLAKAITNTINPLQELLDATNDSKGVKVEAQSQSKILRVRQAIKQIDKASEYLLRITK